MCACVFSGVIAPFDIRLFLFIFGSKLEQLFNFVTRFASVRSSVVGTARDTSDTVLLRLSKLVKSS